MLKGGTCVIIIDNVIRKVPGNDFDYKETTGNNCYGIPPNKKLIHLNLLATVYET